MKHLWKTEKQQSFIHHWVIKKSKQILSGPQAQQKKALMDGMTLKARSQNISNKKKPKNW